MWLTPCGCFPVRVWLNLRASVAHCPEFTAAFNQLQDDIQDYFTHLGCAAPKLAHYAGYIIGNNILPWVEPGYHEDYCQTMAFAAETEKYMGYLPL